jgi:hypothetical protein
MSQVLGAFVLLDFTMLRVRPRLVRVLKLMNRLFLNVNVYFGLRSNRG